MKVENLAVTVKYEVILNDVEMPQEVYDELIEANEDSNAIDPTDPECSNSTAWLQDNIEEEDGMNLEYEIDVIS